MLGIKEKKRELLSVVGVVAKNPNPRKMVASLAKVWSQHLATHRHNQSFKPLPPLYPYDRQARQTAPHNPPLLPVQSSHSNSPDHPAASWSASRRPFWSAGSFASAAACPSPVGAPSAAAPHVSPHSGYRVVPARQPRIPHSRGGKPSGKNFAGKFAASAGERPRSAIRWACRTPLHACARGSARGEAKGASLWVPRSVVLER